MPGIVLVTAGAGKVKKDVDFARSEVLGEYVSKEILRSKK
jgi:hypothetical protein